MHLLLIRGLPGSGKSTIAQEFVKLGYVNFEQDHFFIRDGVFTYNRDLMGRAIAWCQHQTEEALKAGKNVVVSNTFTLRSDIEPYFWLSKKYGITPRIIIATGNYQSIRGVPEKKIEQMRRRWECFIFK